ncbi:MAG: hypothetical protein OEZ09_00220 [Betaproteobacteria bacterium]|nr:hypothetical protein [Betaproteobacteria bacterium]MDH5576860.1 hypothetical protein [Betaproteobacteria bacterium]
MTAPMREALRILRDEQRLTPGDRAAIAAAFAANEDPLGGVGEREYRQLFQRIAQIAPAPVGLGAPWRKA